ncbi:hypothetical protein BC936DRAFT_137186 [Jimgerdemannia flammicorona]|uniref:Uncharacterized protein n=1 Tax=Jimgerdemannia flammicorona TaxID=994334 RepID=A0A433CXX1_9FUNG|nr:hypothetical protein BC936DRAFT_137186 [Jimgerdemannia flammicorona]
MGNCIKVDKMTKEDALLLGSQSPSDNIATAKDIVQELDCLLLAINIARSYIESTGILPNKNRTRHDDLYRNQASIYDEVAPLYQMALAISANVLGTEDPHTATFLNNLADLNRSRASAMRQRRCPNGHCQSVRRYWEQSTRTQQQF